MSTTGTRTSARRLVKAGTTVPTEDILAHAAAQARQRKFTDLLIVDADSHHYETDSWMEIASHIQDPVLRRQALGGDDPAPSPKPVAEPTIGAPTSPRRQGSDAKGLGFDGGGFSGRIPRYATRGIERGDGSAHRDAVLARRAMDAMGIDYSILFPSPMLQLGVHPLAEVEVAVAFAYARWMTEQVLPGDSRIKTMLYLPFNDPGACLRLVEEFGQATGVVGFLVASVRHRAVHDNAYMPLYAQLERAELPLGFHGSYNYGERSFELLNRFLSVHALGFPFHTMVHMTNWVINGLPERFPGLRTVWIEGGVAFVPFLMQRLDHEYMMRSSEAPLLRQPPSEYMREFFYTSQPLEVPLHNLSMLKETFAMINAERQLLYASDYPHWDFDLPSRVYDLPFLTDDARRRIMGENAYQLFQLDRR